MATRKIFNYIDAIVSLHPGGNWSWTSVPEGTDPYEGLNWMDQTKSAPTKSQLQAEVDRLQSEYDAEFYQKERAVAYPSIQDQLDMLYWDKVNNTNNWQTAIAAVKSQYPK